MGNLKFDGERIIPDVPELKNLYEIHLATYRFFSRYTNDCRVLDIGTGCGYGSYYLAIHGSKEVTGVDNDHFALDFARGKYQNSNLNFEYMDIIGNNSSKTDQYDAVCSFQVMEHLEDSKTYLSRINSLLNYGGIVSISTPNRLVYSPAKKKPSNPYHYKEYSPAELVDLLSAYFKDIEIWGQRINNEKYQSYEDSLRKKVHNVPIWLRKNVPTFLSAPIIKRLKGKNPVNLKQEEIIFSEKDLDDAPILIAVGYKGKRNETRR